ncbi:STAS domain-containing protein [Actinoplanes sp. NPDC026619]|uniref:STAS domain-containing protein n=1 Tax=Actinoplanes sp. NPDC026619 TaxID=3155798 RepID=UPI0033D87066
MGQQLDQLSIDVHRRAGSYRIQARGDIDQASVTELREALAEGVARTRGAIELDLSGATFFCCGAVAALMSARETSAGRLTLVGAAPVVNEVLRLVGLAETFGITGNDAHTPTTTTVVSL